MSYHIARCQRLKPNQIRTAISLTISALMTVTYLLPAKAQIPSLTTEKPQRECERTQLPEAYTLGPGDRIQVDIFNVPEYSREYQVLVDGTVNLSLVGSLYVQGMDLKQAAIAIGREYSTYIQRPDLITITLVRPRPLKVAVAGEVNRPGTYALSQIGRGDDKEGVQIPTVTTALQAAGGITQSADLRRVQLRRTQRSGPEQIVNLWELLQTGDLCQDVTLRDGDTIFVPTSTIVNRGDAVQLSSTSISGDPTRPLNVAIVGEVNRPGSYTIQRVDDKGTQLGLVTVTRAIQTAGGITQLADIRRVQVRRTTKIGSEQVIDVDLWQLLQAGDLSQDIILDQGDTVIVPPAENIDLTEAPEIASASFSPERITVNIVGEVVRPGAVAVPPNTSLNQALLAAGGFNNQRARKSKVELIRLNPNGTVSRRTITVDFSQELNEETNPSLRNNDVIVVGRSNLARFSDTLGTVLSPLGGIFSLFNFFRLFR